jgi:hypothetical protein
MKHLLLFAVLSLVLAACTGVSAPSNPNCSKGICVKVGIDEPVRFKQTVNVKITVETEQDMSHVGVYLSSNDPSAVSTEGTVDWFVDTKAHQSVTVTGKMRFIREGYVGVIGAVTTPSVHVQDGVTVHITSDGGTIYLSGTPLPITPVVIKRLRPTY